jgi:uncharacterized membrane protein YhaH (DUF805 family)
MARFRARLGLEFFLRFLSNNLEFKGKNMGNLLFSPNGRIGSQDFMKAGVILIVVGVALSLLKIMNPSAILLVGTGNILLLYPWITIWVKRLHNGNKSGAMIFGYIGLYIAIILVLTIVVMVMFGDGTLWNAAQAYAKKEITYSEYMSVVETASEENLALPSLIAGVIASFITLVIGDKATPNDAGDNRFGPA